MCIKYSWWKVNFLVPCKFWSIVWAAANTVVANHLGGWHMDSLWGRSMAVARWHHQSPTSTHKWASIEANHSSQQQLSTASKKWVKKKTLMKNWKKLFFAWCILICSNFIFYAFYSFDLLKQNANQSQCIWIESTKPMKRNSIDCWCGKLTHTTTSQNERQ